MSNITPIDRKVRREAPIVNGRVPPHDLDAEAAVLAACLLKRPALEDVAGILTAEQFYNRVNGRVFTAIQEVAKRGPVDLVTVNAELRDREVLTLGGKRTGEYLAEIVDTTPAVANVTTHAKIVARKARIRDIIVETAAINAEGYGDVGDEDLWIAEAEKRLHAIVELGASAESESEAIIEPTRRVFKKYLALSARPQDELVTTGFPDLDRMLSLEPGTLVVIGARSGRGKSSMATQFANHVAQKWGNALYFSSEMPSEQLALRAACMLASVDSKRVRRGMCSAVEGARLTEACNQLRDTAAFLNDKSGLDIMSIAAIARREVKRIRRATGKPVRLIVIDYLQRIKAGRAASRDASREQQVAAIAFRCKELAMELKTCVVVPAQLNADADKRDDERPRVSDLRESKNIENEADEVVLIHNPSYVARTENEHADLSVPEPCEIIKGKGRSDGNGLTHLWFTPIYSRFDSMTEADKAEQARIRDDARSTTGRRGRR